MQHLTEEQLILFHYREGDESEQTAQHLEACADCRLDYESLSHTLGSVTRTLVPDRSAAYGSEVWSRLAPQLASSPQSGLSRWLGVALGKLRWPSGQGRTELFLGFGLREWCLGAGVLGLASAAFLTGQFWREPVPPPDAVHAHWAQPGSAVTGQQVLFEELGAHLERSQLALIELLNSKNNGPVDISIEQVLARELVEANRSFCRTAASLDDRVVMSALEDLERTLLEILNGPAHLSSEQFAELRRRLGPDLVLCKIKVVEAQLQAKRAAQELTEHRS